MEYEEITNIKDLKVDDEIVVTEVPKHWSSALNDNDPIENCEFPYALIIQEVVDEGMYVAMTCGNYGWDLSSLVNMGIVKRKPKDNPTINNTFDEVLEYFLRL